MAYFYLMCAILLEIIGTSALKASEQFTRLLPVILVVVGYMGSFYFLSLTLKTIPMGVSYALWSGIGIVLITLVGVFWFKQHIDLGAIFGMCLIIAGVAVMHLFSNTISH